MKGMLKLLKGELKRLVLYKILPVSLVTSLIWIGIFLFISAEEARELLPMLIFVDASLMAVILVGASHHLERQEGVIKSMMIMPVSMGQILCSKIIASMVLAVEAAVIASLALLVIHGVTVNYALLLLYVVIVGTAHAAIGFFLALHSRDFAAMLAFYMAYMIPMTLLPMLNVFGIISINEWLMFISPSQSSLVMLSSAVAEYDAVKVVAACAYLAALSFVLIRFAVYPKFKNVSVRG